MFWLYWLSGDFHRQQYNKMNGEGGGSSTAFFRHLVQNEAHIISNGNPTYGYTGDCSNVVADCKANSTADLMLKNHKEWQSGLRQGFDCTNVSVLSAFEQTIYVTYLLLWKVHEILLQGKH